MMRIKCKFSIGIVLIVLMLSVGLAYGQGNEYNDPQGRFSFNLPTGWKAAVPYDSAQAAYFVYAVQQGNVGELIIMIEKLPFSASIDQYAAASEENGFKQLPGYVPGTQLPATVFGLPAIKKNFTFSPQTELTLQSEAFIFISGNFAYTILLDILPDYFAQTEPGFSQAVASFKVQGGAPVAVQPVSQPTPATQPVPIIPTSIQPTPVPCPTVEPSTPPPSSSDIGGAPPAPSAPVTPAQPVVPTPTPTIATTPVQPPVTSGMNIFTDPQGRFSFNLPAGWKTAVPYDSIQAAYFNYSIKQGNIGEFSVLIAELSSIISIDQFAEEFNDTFKQQIPSYIPGTQLPTTIFGLPAIKKNFSFNRQTGVTLQAEAYMFICGNSAYTMLLIALSDYFTQVEPGFAQAVPSFKVQSGAPVAVQPAPQPVAPPVSSAPVTPAQPVVPTPTPTIPATLVQPPVTAGINIYADPQGRFSIPIPTGSTTAKTTEIGIVLNTPDGAGIVAMYTLGEQYVQGMVAQIKPNHQFHGQSQLQAGNRQALVELYSKVNPQDNVNYATVVVTYPGTPFMIIVTVPADKYNQAQPWILEMIKGTSIR